MQPAEVNALSDELRAFTERAWQQLQDEQDAILTSWPKAAGDARRKRLNDLQQTAARLTAQVDELALTLATTGLHTAYTLGAAAGGSVQFTTADIDALGVLAQDLYDAVLAATRGVNNSTKLLIRTLAREHVGDRLLGGKTATDAARDLRKELEGKGITSVTYRDGSRQGLAGYTDMLARTQTALAYNHGALNAVGKTGVKYVEIFDGYGCGLGPGHDSFPKANGMIVPLDQAGQYPISHPRCVLPGQTFRALGVPVELRSAWFEGPVYTLTTWSVNTGFHTATVGPHHPVLTSMGWKEAQFICEGDQLVHDVRRPDAILRGASHADLERRPPLVEEVLAALGLVGEVSSAPAASDDLHGDAIFCKGEVSVVRADRELLDVLHTASIQQASERDFVRPDLTLSLKIQLGAGGALLQRVPAPPGSLIGGGRECQTVLTAPAAGAEPLSFTRAAGEAVSVDCFTHTGVMDSKDAGDFGARLLFDHVQPMQALDILGRASADDVAEAGACRNVGLDGEGLAAALAGLGDRHFATVRVVSSRVSRYVGRVYDAETTLGAFAVNGMVVKNCTRSFAPRPDVIDDQGATAATRSQTAAQAQDQRQVQIVRQARVEARARRLAARRQKIDARSGA